MKDKNLTPEQFPETQLWNTDPEHAVKKLFSFLDSECSNAISWYLRKKRCKRKMALIIRITSIISFALTGVIPILSKLWFNFSGEPVIPVIWGSLTAAFGGLLYSIDRFAGFTSGWIRFVRTARKLTLLQADFRMTWIKSYNGYISERDTNDDKKFNAIMDLARDYLLKVHGTVNQETDEWARTFQSIIKDMDGKQKTDRKITVHNHFLIEKQTISQ